MELTLKFAVVVILIIQTDGFKIVSHSQHEVNLQPGENVTLTCKTDNYWEYCQWKHNSRKCDFEWKYAKKAVVRTTCHDAIDDRITLVGDYESHDCSIHIRNLDLTDSGAWECQIEEYVFGGSRGTKDKQKIKINIASPTTTTSSTTALPTSTTVSTAPSTTVTNSEATTTTTADTETDQIVTENVVQIKETSEDTKFEESIDDENDYIEADDENDYIEALPVSDQEASSEPSVGLIVGVIVSLIAMSLVLVVAGVTWHRRRKSHLAIISYLQTERDDAMAANAFLEEAEYHISIIRDPQSLPLQQKQTLDTATAATDEDDKKDLEQS